MLVYAEGLRKVILENEKDTDVFLNESVYDLFENQNYHNTPFMILLVSDGPLKKILKDIKVLKPLKDLNKIVLFCSRKCWVYVNRLNKAEVSGFIDYEDQLLNINLGLSTVFSGKYYMSDSICELLFNEKIMNNNGNPFDRLSDLEYIVAEELSLHGNVDLIAKELNISVMAVMSSKRRVYRKLKIKNSDDEFRKLVNSYKPFLHYS